TGWADRAANANGWYNADVTVSFNVGDDLSGVASSSSPVTLTEGANQSVPGTVTDLAGNSAGYTVSGINIDETKPTASIDSHPAGLTNSPSASFTFSGSDLLSGVDHLEHSLDGGSFTTGTSADFSGLGEGTHTLTVRSVDRAGNVGDAVSYSWAIDLTPPDVSAPDLDVNSDSGISNSDNITKYTSLTFNGTAEAGSTVQLWEGTNLLGTTTADGSGNWGFSG